MMIYDFRSAICEGWDGWGIFGGEGVAELLEGRIGGLSDGWRRTVVKFFRPDRAMEILEPNAGPALDDGLPGGIEAQSRVGNYVKRQ